MEEHQFSMEGEPGQLDVPKLRAALIQIAECSSKIRALNDMHNNNDDGQQDLLGHYLEMMQFLRDQHKWQRAALEQINRALRSSPLSAQIRARFFMDGNGSAQQSAADEASSSASAPQQMQWGLSDFLQMIDNYAETLPLYCPPTVTLPKQRKWWSFRNSSTSPYLRQKDRESRRSADTVVDECLPPLVGTTPLENDALVGVGALVAFWDGKQWILAEILDYKPDANGGHYTLLDHMAEFEFYRKSRTAFPSTTMDSGSSKRDNSSFVHRKVRRPHIVPLPTHRADPRQHPNALFGPGTIVLARFPKTTTFYRGCVLAPPANARDGYQITFNLEAEFDLDIVGFARDSSVSAYTIPQLFVIQEPDECRQYLHNSQQ